jgi:hypothetical protein
MMIALLPNQPAALNPAMTLWFQFGSHCRPVGEP